MSWTLVGPDGKPYASRRRGTLGGHRGSRIYGQKYQAWKRRKKRSARKAGAK